jgi:hypothetical protein
MAGHVFYTSQMCPSVQRFEVYRASASALAANPQAFARVLSVNDPVGATDLAGQNLQNGTFAQDFDRGGLAMSLGVGKGPAGEYVLLVAQHTATSQGENSHNEVVQFRLAAADQCNPANHTADLDSCGTINMPPQKIDILPRLGVYELKPQVFMGKVPNGGALDPRVGIVWYAQPYRGQQGMITDEMRARTIMEAAISTDNGMSYFGPIRLSAKDNGPGPPTDPMIGDFFIPCQFEGDPNGYFGEYIGGTFLDGLSNLLTATWADSREGCMNQSSPGTFHMHVWTGWLEQQTASGPPTNACGGTQPLQFPPGASCEEAGQCGRWTCVGTKANAVTCDTTRGTRNQCGGCGLLPLGGSGHGPGDFCYCNDPGREEGRLVCSPKKDRLICCNCNSEPGCGLGPPL